MGTVSVLEDYAFDKERSITERKLIYVHKPCLKIATSVPSNLSLTDQADIQDTIKQILAHDETCEAKKVLEVLA